jgi:hypothetical protein
MNMCELIIFSLFIYKHDERTIVLTIKDKRENKTKQKIKCERP